MFLSVNPRSWALKTFIIIITSIAVETVTSWDDRALLHFTALRQTTSSVENSFERHNKSHSRATLRHSFFSFNLSSCKMQLQEKQRERERRRRKKKISTTRLQKWEKTAEKNPFKNPFPSHLVFCVNVWRCWVKTIYCRCLVWSLFRYYNVTASLHVVHKVYNSITNADVVVVVVVAKK